MSQLREYIVTAKKFNDLESLYNDIETSGLGQYGCMPSREVECYVRRPISRNTHYLFTDEEAVALASDPRILAVELTPEERGLVWAPTPAPTDPPTDPSSSVDPSDYNEVVSAPTSVERGTSFTITISGGVPNTGWSYYSGWSSSSGRLDSSGGLTITVPDSAQPYSGLYSYDFYFYETQNSRSVVVEATDPPPPPPPDITYDEVVTAPTSVQANTSFTMSISGGEPYTTWICYLTDATPGTGTQANGYLDGSGNASFSIPSSTQSSAGTYSYTIYFYSTGHYRSVSVTAISPPTYTLTPASSSVNEGSSLTFTVGGTNITNGTYYWTVTNSVDFGTSSGSFTITSNAGSFSVTPRADLTTEGAETFTVSIRSGSISGTILQTSSSITINDTSTSAWTQTSSQWSKSSSLSQGDLNWGLYRVFRGSQVSNWGYDGTEKVSGTVSIPLRGANVDVVIVDGMLDPNHPEFAVNSDGTGGSRVIQYNWYALTPLVTGGSAGTYSYLLDPADQNYKHSHHVAGVTAGNTQGWARGANIFNISPQYVAGGVNNTYLFDYIRVAHQNKSVNPLTGTKNPTICNNSWGYRYSSQLYTAITSITYRGTTVTKSFTKAELNDYGIYVDDSDHVIIPARVASVDADIADLIAAGVIVVAAAMNDYTKMDVSGGLDYNNTLDIASYAYYTHQGASPGSATDVICVGATGAGVTSGGDRKASYSNRGPRIDVWAPGSYIDSSWIGSAPAPGLASPVPDTRNNLYYTGKSSGTSMASPQVTGVLACLLERYPNLTQADARQWIATALAEPGQIPGGTGVPADYFDLQGAPSRHLKWSEGPATTVYSEVVSAPTSVERGTSFTITISGGKPNTGWSYYSGFSSSGSTLNGSGGISITVPDNAQPYAGIYSYDFYFNATGNSRSVLVTATAPPIPTYTLTPASSSIDEGSSLTFTVGGTNITTGTYYWTITNSGDFGTSSGSFSITNNAGSFSVTPRADLTTEGAETFTASIRSVSTGGTILQTSSLVTINDTSTTSTITRPTSGVVFPSFNYGARPASGQVWPRSRI